MARTFALADWAVFLGMLIVSAAIGVYHALAGGKQRTTGEFLMGNRNMKILPVAVSILVSFLSAILILGAPAEMYTKGTQYYLYLYGQMAAAVLASFLFVPLFYPLKLTSMYQYVEMRFKSRAVRLTATLINISSTLIYTGIASFTPSTALYAVSGFPEWGSFLLIGFVCTFYTFMGGLKAVIWVDAFQAIVMFTGLLSIIIRAVISVGGFGEVWQLNEEWDRINFWNFDPDPTVRHTFWALVIGGMINWTGTFGASQQSIQRFSALPTLRQAKLAVLLNCLGLFIMVTSACVAGISVFAYYAMKGCDPLTNKDIKNSNQIVPYFVMEMLYYPGIPGLFIACLFSGALSSVSSNLSSLVATSWEDIVKPFVQNKSEKVHAWITRLLVLIFGVLGVSVAFLVRNLGGTVLQASLSFMGAAGGALNGFVVLGAFFPCCNWIGAIVGPMTSYVFMMWIGIAKYSVVGTKEVLPFPTGNCHVISDNITMTTPVSTLQQLSLNISTVTTFSPVSASDVSGLNRLYSLSYLWYATLGVIISVVVGLVTSLLTGRMHADEIDPKYLIPVCDRLCCYLPKSFRNRFTCDVDYSLTNKEDDTDGTNEDFVQTDMSSNTPLTEYDNNQEGHVPNTLSERELTHV